MTNHFSSIGFSIESHEALVALAERLAPEAQVVQVAEGKYLRWVGKGGEELWFQLGPEGDFIGAAPQFSGSARLRIGIVGRIARAEETALDGALHAWADPQSEAPASGEYPFVFDLPDACTHADLVVPSIAEAQIAAFAMGVEYFASEEAYDAAQEEDGVAGYAAQMFIPVGLFADDEDDDLDEDEDEDEDDDDDVEGEDASDAEDDGVTDEDDDEEAGEDDGEEDDDDDSDDPAAGSHVPTAKVSFAGFVRASETKINAFSGEKYHWALVDTLGGAYDVVIDPALLDAAPAVGGILMGTFWLSGRLVPAAS